MSIPLFPHFKNLGLEDRRNIEKITRQFPPYSDYNFVSLWSYNIEDDIEMSILHDNLVFKFRDYVTNEPFYSFLGKNNIKVTIGVLLKMAYDKHVSPILKLIPETNLLHNEKVFSLYLVEEDRDNFDYIYTIEDVMMLQGSKYEKKRNKVNKFKKEYQESKIVLIDLKKSAIHKQLFDVFSLWKNNKKKQKSDTIHELTALKRLLDASNIFDLVCMGIYYRNKLIAFSITEVLPENYSIFHFVKGDPFFIGIFEYLYLSTVQELYKRGSTLVSREQDLGIPGLRDAKTSWRPINFLKKYTISAK